MGGEFNTTIKESRTGERKCHSIGRLSRVTTAARMWAVGSERTASSLL